MEDEKQAPIVDLTLLTPATRNRLTRVMKLRGCNQIQALSYCISMGWILEENKQKKEEKAKG